MRTTIPFQIVLASLLCTLQVGFAAEDPIGVPRPILVVAPHPDDETLGPGGQIALLEKKGHAVHVLVLTDGSQLFVSRFGAEAHPPPSEISRRRKRETERAVALLGADPERIRYLDFRDGRLSDRVDEAAAVVAATIRDLDPVRV